MQNTIPTRGPISWGRRLMPATAALGLLLLLGFAQPAPAQTGTNPLVITNNYFVTGDYVVGGWVKGPSDGTLSAGTINIPDPLQPNSTPVPPGADIVAAFLYWETVQSSNSGAATGMQGSFNGYAITGSFLPSLTPNAPTSWSSGGCSGSSQGSKTIQGYRADVRPFLPVDANGKIQANTTSPNTPYVVRLADTGTNGAKVPFTLGATLVIVYRVQSPQVPLNSIILYDGTFAPNNGSSTMSQQIVGFYQAAISTPPVAKITHIVGNGQANKNEQVLFNGTALTPPNTAAFPGTYNGSWDNPTFNVSSLVPPGDVNPVNTMVIPPQTNSSCVNWGAVIFSTTVQDTDGDGLLDVWEDNQGYTDALSGQFVALPGANKSAQDIFVEIDYLSNLDGLAGIYLHSHLPKQEALDKVGSAFAAKNVHVHFDVGNVYQSPRPGGPSANCGTQANPIACDPYIISNPAGTGGNAISESVSLCNDATSPTLCPFPGTPAVAWKGGFVSIKQNTSVLNSNPPILLGNFQLGRKDSYHYVLFGHALGAPRSFWTSFAATLQTSFAQLISIVNSGVTATVTIQTPQGLFKPGDCPNPLIPACSDANVDRVTVGGALGQLALNGTYHFTNLNSSTGNNVTITTFNIITTGVANGTYNFSSEPRLAVTYGGPSSSSGHSDVGGGDTTVTFGLWGADDVSGCQADPSVPSQTYCVNQVGTITAEAGTLLHELGHTFFLTHGGTFFPNGAVAGQQRNNPLGVPSYGLNCNPGFLSAMNYLFQIRGFPDLLADGSHPIDYSGQTLPPLSEAALNETLGIGSDLFGSQQPAAHFTRWYAPPNALDTQLQTTTGGRFATLHCDGTPIAANEPPSVRVDGSTFSAPIDWNNDLFVPDAVNPQDVNFNGIVGDALSQGFNDWINVDLRQVGSRANASGFSSGGTPADLNGGGTPPDLNGGGTPADLNGGGTPPDLNGGGIPADLNGGGTPADLNGGGAEQDSDTANSTADAPTGLACTNCVVSSGTLVENGKSVSLAWTPPGFGQIRRYDVWRATGSFPKLKDVLANLAQFTDLTPNGLKGAPPLATFTDPNVKNNVTYTYFVTDTNKQGAQSGASAPVTILVRF